MTDYVAQFLAKGGKVTSLPIGATNGMTSRDWKDATSDRGISPANRYTEEQRSEQFMEEVREARHMGGIAAANEVMGY